MRAWRLVKSKRVIMAALAVAAAIGVTLGVLAAPGRSVSPQGPFTFAALTNGSPVASASLPADVQTLISLVAPKTGEDASTLSQNVHLVRQSLGPKGLDVYAFEDNSGDPCFDVPAEGGTCGFSAESQTPGLYFRIGGGNGGNEPSYLFALASDNIQSIDLTVDGNDRPVSIENNIAFASYPNTAKTATVTVHYTNGSTSSDSLSLGPPAGTSG